MTNFYDVAPGPADLRVTQLALTWAIVACAPVEMGRLCDIPQTDQTTLSRTVEKLRQADLVAVEAGTDRRVRMLRLMTSDASGSRVQCRIGRPRSARWIAGYRSMA